MSSVPAHWIVARYTPAIDGAPDVLGTVENEIYDTLQSATSRAKELAGTHPGLYYVVYSALWYAFTDITPVSLERVGAVG